MRDRKTYSAEVTENLPGTNYRVRMDDGKELIAHLSGRMYLNKINVTIGDKVEIVLAPDGSIGRITRRL